MALADEGMWTFNSLPRAEIKKRYGFELTDAWIKKVQLASVRFNNGGSGSFVSPNGLVLTNHHIASQTLHELSTEKKDLLKEGFYAPTLDQELRSPNLELNVLMSIEDVTSRVNSAVTSGMSSADAYNARQAEINKIQDESKKATGLRSDVVVLYQGGQYNLYRYKRYTDVRLVFAPEFEIAFFGGDPDNFTFPRYCLDMALYRVYEDDKPIKVENYFRWSTDGTQEKELVFVSGNPGNTERLNTMAHLDFLRDVGIPLILKNLERRNNLLKAYSSKGEEELRRAQETIFSVENSLKAYRGYLQGLKNQKLMERKLKAEKRLRKFVSSNPERAKKYGDAWDQVATVRKALLNYERERRFLDTGWGLNSTLFTLARQIVRLGTQSQLPNTERLPEYTDANRPSLELQIFSPAPIYDDFERMKLIDAFTFMRDELGADNPDVKTVLAGKSPTDRANELINSTKLKDVNYRKELVQGGLKAIEASDDPMIVLARAIDKRALELRERYQKEVVGVERDAYAKISQALFEMEGTKLYPDATFTLRLNYGAVKGYKEDDGRTITPYTNFAGLYERAEKHGNRFPYRLPVRWMEKRKSINLQTPFNFVSTNDTIGGNSGSPIINKNAELVGLLFDGNIQSLVGNFIYDEKQNRSVNVDSRGMLEALRKVYGASELVDELTRVEK
jgi:hypothetical protein